MCTYHLHIISAYYLYNVIYVIHTYTHYLLCIFHIPHIAYYLQLSFRIYTLSALLLMVSMGLNYLLL